MIPTLPPLRTKWSDFSTTDLPSFHEKIREELIRDQILDWVNHQSKCMAWWVEPQRALVRRRGKLLLTRPNNRHYLTGVPDIIGSWKGRPLAIEVKRPAAKGNVGAGRVSEDQVAFMHRARATGWICFFAWRLEHVKQCIQEFDQFYGVGL